MLAALLDSFLKNENKDLFLLSYDGLIDTLPILKKIDRTIDYALDEITDIIKQKQKEKKDVTIEDWSQNYILRKFQISIYVLMYEIYRACSGLEIKKEEYDYIESSKTHLVNEITDVINQTNIIISKLKNFKNLKVFNETTRPNSLH